MAFALWVDHECAWAEGTHEYRPMGVAVIAVTGTFHASDFSRSRRPPSRRARGFRGLFASIEDVNRHLQQRRSHRLKKVPDRDLSGTILII